MIRHALWLSLALCACSIETHRSLQPASVQVSLANPYQLTKSPLVSAVVITTPDPHDRGDAPLLAGQTGATLILDPLSSDLENRVTPAETVELDSNEILTVYRPRLIVYEDVDNDQQFNPKPPLGTGVDEVWAIDEGSAVTVAAVLGLDNTLSELTLEEQEAYYQLTGGVYTPFIFVSGSSGRLALTRLDQIGPIQLALSDSPVPQEELSCGRGRVSVYGDGTGATRNIHALVALTLDSAVACGVDIPDCTSVDLPNLPAPALDATRTPGSVRLTQCRTNGVIQALIVQEAKRTCSNCVCPMTPLATVYFADGASVPPWWPCGAAVPFCDSTLPLYYMDTSCP